MASTTPDGPRPEPEPSRGPILVCLDRSTIAEACIPPGLAWASTFGCALTLVHVLAPAQEAFATGGSDALAWELTRQEAGSYLERLASDIGKTLQRPVGVRLEQGRPAERIVDLAAEIGASLTVLGSCGKGVAEGRGLGSVARRVLALGGGSVFIAHASIGADTAVRPVRILLPLDGSLRGESVLPVVTRIARENGAEILLLHVVQEPRLTCLLEPPKTMALARALAVQLESNAGRYLDRLRVQLSSEVPNVRALVTRSMDPYQTILELSRTEHRDLVVLSAHGASGDGERSFGNVTSYLLTHGRIPILVLQDVPAPLPARGALDARAPVRAALVAPASP